MRVQSSSRVRNRSVPRAHGPEVSPARASPPSADRPEHQRPDHDRSATKLATEERYMKTWVRRSEAIGRRSISGYELRRIPRKLAGSGSLDYLKMFTALAATRRIVIDERADSVSMRSFDQRVSGIASVGLKAIEFVKER